MSGGQKEIRSWTALRGIFILGIVLYHVSGDYQQPFGVFSEACLQGGLWGNSFFFLTSGLVCAMSLNRSGDGMRFLRNRVRRVYPWYAATNGLMLLLNVLRHGVRWQITLSDTVPIFLMTSSGWVRDIYPYNSPTWFISALMLVSLVFVAIHSLRKKNRLLYRAVSLLLACWGRVLIISGWNVPFCYIHDG